jgi:succinate dehydrogenase hydrophobic anchor subunit
VPQCLTCLRKLLLHVMIPHKGDGVKQVVENTAAADRLMSSFCLTCLRKLLLHVMVPHKRNGIKQVVEEHSSSASLLQQLQQHLHTGLTSADDETGA